MFVILFIFSLRRVMCLIFSQKFSIEKSKPLTEYSHDPFPLTTVHRGYAKSGGSNHDFDLSLSSATCLCQLTFPTYGRIK